MNASNEIGHGKVSPRSVADPPVHELSEALVTFPIRRFVIFAIELELKLPDNVALQLTLASPELNLTGVQTIRKPSADI